MVKKHSLFILLVICANLFGQNDTIKKYTYLSNYDSNKLKIEGNWKQSFQNKYENIISHCPILKDDKNNILEFAKWDSRRHPLVKGNDLTKINLSFINYLNENKIEILGLETGPKRNFFFYALKLNSKVNPDQKIILYYLIGVKGYYVYRIATYNYEIDRKDSFTFLTSTFNNN